MGSRPLSGHGPADQVAAVGSPMADDRQIRPASRTRSSGTSRFSAIDFEVGLAQRKLSNRCVRATCSIE